MGQSGMWWATGKRRRRNTPALRRLGAHGASFTWFQASHGADKTGPMAGIPYDGADRGMRTSITSAPLRTTRSGTARTPLAPGVVSAHLRPDRNYHLDLLYTDGAVPFGDVGVKMIANLYNTDLVNRSRSVRDRSRSKAPSFSPIREGERPASQTSREIRARGTLALPATPATGRLYLQTEESEGRWVQDLERGVMAGINPSPGRPTLRSATGITTGTGSSGR